MLLRGRSRKKGTALGDGAVPCAPGGSGFAVPAPGSEIEPCLPRVCEGGCGAWRGAWGCVWAAGGVGYVSLDAGVLDDAVLLQWSSVSLK